MLLEREAQLAALSEYADDARAGRGRLVLVAGEAGIGKTALVETFQRSVGLRTLHGACDGLFTPRALGPLFDVATEAGGALLDACRAERPREELFATLLVTLAEQPTVVVLEDLHWADEATLDLVRHVGRRLKDLPVVVLATYRDDGLSARDPLRVALGELGSQRTTRRIDLAPLSGPAVDELAAAVATSGTELYRLTGGNPFFVTEMLRGSPGTVPPSARDAVLARVARLRDPTRRTAEAAALLGGRVDVGLLGAVCEARADHLDELVVSGLLVSGPAGLRFRHELTRLAIAQEIPAHRVVAIHAAALAALGTRGADEARLAYHAEGAGDAQAVQLFAPRAAERSAQLGSHREAVAQLERALRFIDGVRAEEVADLWTRLSVESGLTDSWDRSREASDAALALWRHAGDPLRIGDALRVRSAALWRLCRQQEAAESAREAVQVLEPLGRTPELAGALARLSVFQDDLSACLDVARRAEVLARELELPDVISDALNTQACALAARGEPWEAPMRESLALAQATRSDAQAGRIYANYLVLLLGERRWEDLDLIAAEGMAYCDEHDIATYGYCIRAAQGEAMLSRGRWDEAVALSQPLVDLKTSPANVVAPLCVVGLVRTRRDQPGGMAALDEAVGIADQTGDLEWELVTKIPRAEAHLLAGDPVAARRDLGECLRPGLAEITPATVGVFLLWLRRAGLSAPDVPGLVLEPPVQLGLAGHACEAAAAWDERQMPYEAAWALLDGGTADEVHEALARFDRIGTPAAARLARQELRRLGSPSVPTGSRAATRAHPAGLTQREAEVLALVAEGMTDEQIAVRLVVSVRTVHHHVSAVLTKLGVTSRHAAATEARLRGLVVVA
ncbi:ATP-binding protein [Nocardioides mesophilus]|uniref:AAA family ATPase n=1 Tax=Nocardioides mesophilus TaxID=433659 RepID=A0A7G9R8B8_9ACTN|nr:AAA family ATPase [Nocardioides mesophilus]QNN51843.1 AAA family ATPase [Nocardioides mesophilus]